MGDTTSRNSATSHFSHDDEQLTEVKGPSSHWSPAYNEANIVGRMKVLKRLGKGRFAAVWRAASCDFTFPTTPTTVSVTHGGHVAAGVDAHNDEEPQTRSPQHIAIKIYRSGGSIIKYYVNEVEILSKLSRFAPGYQGETHVVKYMGTLAHVRTHGVTPYIHPCIVFNDAGDSLSTLLRFCRHKYKGGIPVPVAKKITKQLFMGLEYIHRCGIIHADIKPSNILLNTTVCNLTDTTLCISIADFGSSSTVESIFSRNVGTTSYIAPELVIETPMGTSIDIWSACAVCYELITGDILFDVYEECDTMYGSDVDGEAVSGLISSSKDSDYNADIDTSSREEEDIERTSAEKDANTSTTGDVNTSTTGDKHHNDNHDTTVATHYSDASSSGEHRSGDDSNGNADSSGDEVSVEEAVINYRYMLLIVKLLGYPPEPFIQNARAYFNVYGRLYKHPTVVPISIVDMLMSNYDMTLSTCEAIESFLLCGLKYLPEDRFTATQARYHPWLESI